MKITESTVDHILRSEDIESLLQHGAPTDEYSHEASSIVSAIALLDQNNLTEELLTDLVLAIWARFFGPFSAGEIEMRMPAFKRVAHRMLSQR
jgi:hypothetical protein